MNLATILVIEDNPKHLEDARAFLADKPVEVMFAQTYEEAKPLYDLVDGVISDIFFPEKEGLEESAMALQVAEDLEGNKKFVLNTAGYHHGDKYQEIYDLAVEGKWAFVDVYQRDRNAPEAIEKKMD